MKILVFGACMFLATLDCGTAADPGVDSGSNDAALPPADSGSSNDSSTDASAAEGGVTCSYADASYPPGASFPASDGCNTCSCTSAGGVLCTRCACIRPEASPEPPVRCGQSGADAASNGDASDGNACAYCADTPIVWYDDGGRRFEYTSSTVSPCHTYRYATSNLPPQAGMVTKSCMQDFSCAGFLSALELKDELSQPDMVAALAAAPVLYGTDSRPFDGTVFHIEVGNKVIEVGVGDQIPSGVRGLMVFLRALEKSQLGTGECKRVFGSDASP